VRVLRTVAVAGVVASAFALIATGSAFADPPAGTTPAVTDMVAGGSNTIEALFNTWSTDYNATSPANKLYSFNSTGSATIESKNDANCTGMVRPNGSGAGISTLNTGTKATNGTDYCLDIGRSSRQITAADGPVTSVALAQDAITVATNSTSNAPTTGTFSPAQLQAIFNCTDTKWNQVGGTSTATIVPVLPQSSSGTRQTFLQQINVPTPGSCVLNADGSQAIEENEGTNAAFTGANAANVIAPFSVGSYISQADLATSPNLTGNMLLKKINNVVPVSGSGATAKINTSFPSAFFRTLFAVVRGTSVPTTPINMTPLLGTGKGTGWVCTDPTAKADIAKQGFLTSPNCGTELHF
jgi:ABC-type phosphate transport system substrate-binding protein